VEIERALGAIAYMLTRARRHELIKSAAAVPIDRAAAVVLRHLADAEAIRPSELAVLLSVEAPHVTRQIQRLQKLGYVVSVADSADRRAHLIKLTPSGRAAAERILQVSRQSLQAALEDWTPADLRRLARLFPRMVDDYLAYVAGREDALAHNAEHL
jgi:DNA-binding MarR family transcriptional regulator